MTFPRVTFSKLEKSISFVGLIYFAISISYANHPENLDFYGQIGSFFNALPTNDAVISHFIAREEPERAKIIANVYAFFWTNYSVLLIVLTLAGLVIGCGKIHEEITLHPSEKNKQRQAYRNMIPFFGFGWIAFAWLAATQGDCSGNCIYISNADFQEHSNYFYLTVHLTMSLCFFGFMILSILRVKK